MRVASGEVVYFNKHRCMGYIRIGENRRVFVGTCFESGRPTRWPEPGDRVQVVFSDIGQILSVRLEKLEVVRT